MNLKRFNYDDILSFNPCFVPETLIGWSGHIVDAIYNSEFDLTQKIFVISRADFISEAFARKLSIKISRLRTPVDESGIEGINAVCDLLLNSDPVDFSSIYEDRILQLNNQLVDYSFKCARIGSLNPNPYSSIIDVCGHMRSGGVEQNEILSNLVDLILNSEPNEVYRE